MTNTSLNEFLNKYDFAPFNVKELSDQILQDMKKGLEVAHGSQQMMSTAAYSLDSQENQSQEKCIIIDAGGTNFRSCLFSVNEKGEPVIEQLQKSSMIALDRELSKEEFYSQLEEKIHYLKDSAEVIKFCFSYAMEFDNQGEAKIAVFSKQVKAKEAVGTYIAKELMTTLRQKGWTTVKEIKIVNDTMACLLAGKSLRGRKYSSYIGFILGTGINNAYIETLPVAKNGNQRGPYMVVCECGFFSSMKQSFFDKELDKKTTNPGSSLLEKMCSGAYMGPLVSLMIRQACIDGLFSAEFTKEFTRDISAYEMDLFLRDIRTQENILNEICTKTPAADRVLLKQLLQQAVERSATIVTSVLRATLLKVSEGLKESQNDCASSPVCITCNGSTFWKTYLLKPQVEQLLSASLKFTEHTPYEIIKIEDDITIGTAMA